MGKFNEARAKFKKECEGTKKTFNENLFNELGTAILNDSTYEKTEMVRKSGELVEKKTTPIGDLRKALIGSVAKAAGSDAAEQEKLIAEHQFGKLPLYDFVDSALREYLSLGKSFPLARQENMQASLEATTVKAAIKEVRRPGEKDTTKQRQGEFIKIKSKSTCPDNLKQNL